MAKIVVSKFMDEQALEIARNRYDVLYDPALIDEKQLKMMKSIAILINSARGGIIDERALLAALKSKKLGGAALDVFGKEPVTAESGKAFCSVPNLLLAPHIAGITHESNERVSWMTIEKILKHLENA